MLAEFAVEPAAMVANFDRFAGMIDRFGIDQGRIISDFAQQKWVRAVWEASAHLPPSERSSVEARLQRKLRERAIVPLRTYRPAVGDWMANVRSEHARLPWEGVVTENGSGGLSVECRAILADNGVAPFLVQRQKRIARTSKALAEAASLLLFASRSVHLVDPHFTVDSSRARNEKWVEPVLALIEEAASGAPLSDLTIHTLDGDRKPNLDDLERHCRTAFERRLPRRVALTLRRWKHRAGGEQMHDRYILTDIGGLSVDYGLDVGPAGTTTPIKLLDRGLWEEQLAHYAVATSPFNEDGCFTIRSTR